MSIIYRWFLLGCAGGLLVGVAVWLLAKDRDATTTAKSTRDRLTTLNARLRNPGPAASSSSPRALMFSRISMDPRLPHYDPTEIADLFGVTPSEIVAHEPVVESFAKPRSMRLRAILERDLANDFPDANVVSVDCRTSSCSIEITCPPSQGDAIFEYVQHPTLGDEVQPDIERGDEQSTIRVYILYRKEHRAADAFDAFYRQERELLPEMRQAGMLVPGLD